MKKYSKPEIEIIQTDMSVNLMENSFATCDCRPHRGNHSKCGKGCHSGEAVGHDDLAWNGWE